MTFAYIWSVFKKVDDVAPRDKLVLAALAFCRDYKTGLCNPSYKTIARMTGFKDSTVENSVKHLLEKTDYLEKKSGISQEGNTSNQYTLHLPLDECPESLRKGLNLDCKSAEKGSAAYGGNPPAQGNSTPAAVEPYPHGGGTLPSQSGTKEDINKINLTTTSNNNKKGVGKVEDDFAEYKFDEEVKQKFKLFWKEYPQCPHKQRCKIPDCLRQYQLQRNEYKEGKEAYDNKVLESLAAWKKFWKSTDIDPQYIPSPLNFIGKRLYTILPDTPTSQGENNQTYQEKVYAQAKHNMEAEIAKGNNPWELCEERCANFVDGKCTANCQIPLNCYEFQRPPEDCKRFKEIAPSKA